jgi:hypothetical protein
MTKLKLSDLLTVDGGKCRVSVGPPKALEAATRRMLATLTTTELAVLRLRYQDDPEALAEIDAAESATRGHL